MSYLEFETVAMVDPYAIEKDQLDPEDIEHAEVLKKLHEMNTARQRKSIKSIVPLRAGGSKGASRKTNGAANVEQLSVMSPVDTSQHYYTHVAVSNDTIVAATKDGSVHFFDQTNTITMATISLQRGKVSSKGGIDMVEKVLLDPLGRHAVVITPYSSYYFHMKKGAKPVKHDLAIRAEAGIANFAVGCVGWDPSNQFDVSSGDVLLGSKKSGAIVATRFDSSGVSKDTKRIFELPPDVVKSPITSIAVVPLNSSTHRTKRIILVTSENKLYYFVGYGGYESIFDPYDGAELLKNYISFDIKIDQQNAQALMRSGMVTALTAKKNEALPPCFMWTLGNRYVIQGTVNCDALGPQGGDLSTISTKVVSKTLEVDMQVLVNDAPPALTTGLGKSTATKEDTLKVLSISASYFYIAVTTSKWIKLLAHPACLPWRPLELPTTPAPGGLSGALSARALGGLTSPVRAPTMRAHRAQSILSTGSDDSIRAGSFGGGASSHGTMAPFRAKLSYREMACRCIYEYSLIQESSMQAMEDEEDDFPTNPSMTSRPSAVRSPPQSPIYKHKRDSAVGVLVDPKTWHLFVVTATKLIQVTPSSATKGQFLPLFVDEAKRQPLPKSISDAMAGLHPTMPKKTPSEVGYAAPSEEEFDPFAYSVSLAGTSKKALWIVNRCKAEWLLNNGAYNAAAALFAEPMNKGTDEIIVTLAALPSTEPLLTFLDTKIKNILRDRRTFDEGQIELHCLASWMVHLMLDRCNQEAIEESREAKLAQERPAFLQQQIEEQRELENEGKIPASNKLQKFMQDQYDVVMWGSLREGVMSIGNEKDIVFICRLLKRFDEVLEHYIVYKRYFEAVNLLLEFATESPAFFPLWERYSNELIRHLPVRLVKHGWIPHGTKLGIDPLKLIPALSNYKKENNETEAMAAGLLNTGHMDDFYDDLRDDEDALKVTEHMGIVYLQHVIDMESNTDESIHNLLLRFLVTDGSDQDLVGFLRSSQHIDRQYALRLATEFNRVPARVEIYFAMGFISEAVHLALSVGNVPLAKEYIIAIKPGVKGTEVVEPRQLRQTLWDDVISYVACREGGARNSLLLIGESGDDVNVSHVLPHFSNDVMICEFKHELLANVKNFGRLMNHVRDEIVSATGSADNLRKDLDHEKKKFLKISSQKKCDACGQLVLSRSAVAFHSCGHVFHTQCFKAQSSISIRNAGEECYLCATDFPRAFLNRPLNSTSSESKVNLSLL